MSQALTPNIKVDVKKALELRRLKGLSFGDIGKMMGCTKQAVQQALKRFDKVLLPAEQLEAYRGNKADIMESVEFELLNEVVDPARIEKASLNNVAYALGTIGNMTRLEQGKSTSNISFKDMSSSLEEIQREREQLQEVLDGA